MKSVKVQNQTKKRDFSKLIPWVAGIGLILTIELIRVYYMANFVEGAAPSFCAINETIDCDAVARTNFSLFLGVPNAIWGFLFYSFVLVLYYAKKLKEVKIFKFLEVFEHPKTYIHLLSIALFLVDITLGYISTMVIGKICLLCFITYAVTLVLVLVSKPSKSYVDMIITAINDFLKAISNMGYAIAFFAVVTLGVSALIYFEQTKFFAPPEESVFLQNIQDYETTQTGNTLGEEGAKVVINEFTDIQCPHCARSNKMVNKIAEDYDNVLVIHHDFPLDKECNRLLQVQMHPNSCLYSQYALAAKKQGKEWGLVNIMFKNNADLTEEKVLEYAKELGLDVNKLKKDAYSKEIKEQLKDEIETIIDMNIDATPTYIINGKKYSGLKYTDLIKIVKENGGVAKKDK